MKAKLLAYLLPLLAMSGMNFSGRKEMSDNEMRAIIRGKLEVKNRNIPNGCNTFVIEDVEIVALNKQNAIRKFNKMKHGLV
jgi:hypothetical protein